MLSVAVPAPQVNKRPKTKGKPKRLPDGKLAPVRPIPAFLNANQRMNHHQKANITKLWREAALEAVKAKRPEKSRSKWFIAAMIHLPRNVSYDAMNYAPSAKAILDGIVSDYGFLPDDSNDYVVGPLCIKGTTASDGFGGITFVMFDLNLDMDKSRVLEFIRKV